MERAPVYTSFPLPIITLWLWHGTFILLSATAAAAILRRCIEEFLVPFLSFAAVDQHISRSLIIFITRFAWSS